MHKLSLILCSSSFAAMGTLGALYYEYDPKTNTIIEKPAEDGYKIPSNIPGAPQQTPEEKPEEPKLNPVDVKITEDIRNALLNESTLTNAASNISVVTSDGKVTLVGIVKTQAEKDKAEEIAKGVSGVKSLNNKIFISTSP